MFELSEITIDGVKYKVYKLTKCFCSDCDLQEICSDSDAIKLLCGEGVSSGHVFKKKE
jgi:hypothetical protein